MYKFFFSFCMLFILLSCDNDDTINFERGRKTDVTENQIIGIWKVKNLLYKGKVYEIPTNSYCENNYTVILENHRMFDRIFEQNSNCQSRDINYKWSLKEGVVNMSYGNNKAKWVVLSVNQQQMSIRLKIDINKDGKEEEVKATLSKYLPTYKNNKISIDVSYKDKKLNINWNQFKDSYIFGSYELHRISNDGKEILLKKITDINLNHFKDSSISNASITYKLYIKDKHGNTIKQVETEYNASWDTNESLNILSIAPINKQQAKITIAPYETPLFSHYKITLESIFSNLPNTYKATFSEMSQTSFVVDIPYYSNPTYIITVHFRGKNNETIEKRIKLNYTRQELISITKDPKLLDFYFAAKSNKMVYFNEWELKGIDYLTKKTKEIFKKESTVIFKILEQDNNKNTLTFLNDKRIYTVDLMELTITNSIELPGSCEDIVKIKDCYILVDWQTSKLKSYKLKNKELKFISEFENYYRDNYKMFVNSENSLIIQADNSVWQEIKVRKDGSLEKTENTIHYNFTKKGIFNTKEALYIDKENKIVIDSRSGKTIKDLSHLENIIGYSNETGHFITTEKMTEESVPNTETSYPSLFIYDKSGSLLKTYKSNGFPITATEKKDGSIISLNSGIKGFFGYNKIKFLFFQEFQKEK